MNNGVHQTPQGAKLYTVEQMFDVFLKLSSLDKRKMPAFQLKSMRQAFYAGFGQSLLHSRDEIGALPEDRAIKELVKLEKECAEFWVKETLSKN